VRRAGGLAAAGLALALVVSVAAPAGAAPQRARVFFEANRGQAPADVAFVGRVQGRALGLAADGVRLAVGGEPVVLRFPGGAPRPALAPAEPLASRSHYLRGADPARWRTDVPHFARVRYRAVWPGIDVEFREGGGELEFDFLLEPGADPERIAISFEGADRVAIEPGGDLAIHAGEARLVQRRPVVFQERDGGREPVDSRYVARADGGIGVAVGAYDAARALIVDPVLVYATALGGPGDDEAFDVAVDEAGNAYVAGQAASTTGLPTAGGLQEDAAGGTDAFVVKLDPDGALVWATYLGGSADDAAWSIRVDDAGSAYVSGRTASTDFPTASPLQAANAGGDDAFVAKLAPDGASLVFSTYLGGAGDDNAQRLALTAQDEPVLKGVTESSDFPTANAIVPVYRGNRDAFVAKLAADGQSLLWSTYFGGTGAENPDETGVGIAVDADGNVITCGTTESDDFPTAAALQETFAGGTRDGYVAKFSPDGAIVFSTYLGSSGGDTLRAVAVDARGYLYATGASRSFDFPLVNPIQSAKSLDYDAVVVKLDPAGQRIVYSTFLGGKGTDAGRAIVVDEYGNAYIHGQTLSDDFPEVFPIADQSPGLLDAFVAQISPSGSGLLFSSRIGGSLSESSFFDNVGIALDGVRNVLLAGATESPDARMLNAIDPVVEDFDGYVLKIGPTPAVRMELSGSASTPDVAVYVLNASPSTVDGQVKVFRQPVLGGTAAPVDLGVAPLVTAAPGVLEWASERPLPGGFTSAERIVVRLLDRVSGQLLAEAVCLEVPCP
jgi:hypothetical protein